MYQWLKGAFANVVGSEFLGSTVLPDLKTQREFDTKT